MRPSRRRSRCSADRANDHHDQTEQVSPRAGRRVHCAPRQAHIDQHSGNLQAGALLGLFLEEIGPGVYNKGVADTQERPSARGMEIDIEVREDEFDDWRKHGQRGARATRRR